MNRSEGRRNASGGLIPVIVIAVLIVLALVLLFVWSPWSQDSTTSIDETVPEAPGPADDGSTPVTRMLRSLDQTAWITTSPAVAMSYRM